MNRPHALQLAVMVALLALTNLPTAAAASTCSGAFNCQTCCGALENLCSSSCSHSPNPVSCLNRCWATYQTCLMGCSSSQQERLHMAPGLSAGGPHSERGDLQICVGREAGGAAAAH